jgi:hypothetical protein
MKYMNQRTFDVFSLRTLIAKVTHESGTAYSIMVGEYNQTFDGDYLFMSQGSQVADYLISDWSQLAQMEQVALANRLMMVRAELDDDLNKKSTLSKLFAGPAFIKSHPNPNARGDQAIQNINIMLAVL